MQAAQLQFSEQTPLVIDSISPGPTWRCTSIAAAIIASVRLEALGNRGVHGEKKYFLQEITE
jgi:hypothetical protein